MLIWRCDRVLDVREKIQVAPGYEKLMPFIDERHPFESVCEYFGFELGKEQRHRSKVVRRVLDDADGGQVPVYFKLYGYNRLRRSLPRCFKPSRSRAEYVNLSFFHELGIPACELVAQGEYRNALGIISNCMIITREVEDSVQLDQFIDQLESGDDSEETKRGIRRQIMRSLAANLRKIHGRRFYHDDLKWRNVLVRRAGDAVETFWIDCPNGYFDRFMGLRSKYGTIKDIATLDHLAWRNCTNEERMYFLSCYSGLALDDPALEDMGRKVVDYRKWKLDD